MKKTSLLFLITLFCFIPFFKVNALTKVKNVSVISEEADQIRLQWKKNKKANFYQIKTLRQKSNGKYKLIKRIKTKKNCGPYSKRVEGETITEEEEEEEDGRFILKNLIADFEPWDPETGRAGDFIFDGGLEQVFFEFMYYDEDSDKYLPTFEYLLDEDAEIYSPLDGVVNGVTYQEDSMDYQITININDNPQQMTVGLDHVLNPIVSEGQVISAGDVVGNPGTWSYSGIGRTEIEIYGDNNMHCPFEFFDSNLTEQYQQKVTQLMEDWESFKADDTLYDQAAMEDYAPGCLAWTD